MWLRLLQLHLLQLYMVTRFKQSLHIVVRIVSILQTVHASFGTYMVAMITKNDFLQDIFTIDMLATIKYSLDDSPKHVQ